LFKFQTFYAVELKKMQPAYKPGSVFRIHAMSAIYLVLPSPTSFSGPPLGIGRATLKYRYTWPYNP